MATDQHCGISEDKSPHLCVSCCVSVLLIWRHSVTQLCPIPSTLRAVPQRLASPCLGCWPCGLASASFCSARPRSTRQSSSTMWPDPDALTSSPWVRAPPCQSFAAQGLRHESLCPFAWPGAFSSVTVKKRQ